MRHLNQEGLKPFRSRLRTTLFVVGLGLTAAGCGKPDFRGGGMVADKCIRQHTDLEMKEGDEVFIGVGDIAFPSYQDLAQDALTLRVKDGHLNVDYPGGSNDEHAIVGSGTEPSQLWLRVEENGANMRVSVQPQSDGLLVQLEKTCPGQ